MLRSRKSRFALVLALTALAAGCRSRSDVAAGATLRTADPASPSAPKEPTGKEQYFPLQSYRVGPYAAGGSGFFGGFIDYMQLVNLRDGGVNGVRLTWSECETEYVVERGVECYERLKGGLNGAPAAAMNPLSVGIAYALIDRSTADKIPLITINHGRTDSTDGRVFPYVFPLSLNPYSEISAIVNYIGQKQGGVDQLRGKKIAVLYHGSPYGKETRPIVELLANKSRNGFSSRSSPRTGSSCAAGGS
jgi:branched-chain amino acid transport system substrate-binding protein